MCKYTSWVSSDKFCPGCTFSGYWFQAGLVSQLFQRDKEHFFPNKTHETEQYNCNYLFMDPCFRSCRHGISHATGDRGARCICRTPSALFSMLLTSRTMTEVCFCFGVIWQSFKWIILSINISWEIWLSLKFYFELVN